MKTAVTSSKSKLLNKEKTAQLASNQEGKTQQTGVVRMPISL